MGENPTISFEFTSIYASRMIKYINNYTKQLIELAFSVDVMLRLNEWRFTKQTRPHSSSFFILPVFIKIVCVFIRVVDLFMRHFRLLNEVGYDNIQMYWSVKERVDQTHSRNFNRYSFEPAIQPEPPLLIGWQEVMWLEAAWARRKGRAGAEESAVALETGQRRVAWMWKLLRICVFTL